MIEQYQPTPKALELSIVIPCYNEQEVLPSLFSRLHPALEGLGRSYEIIFVDDGSRDRTPGLLREQYLSCPEVTKVVYLRTNAGQHAAIMAGFAHSRGLNVITLDADLQNPPEEIPKLVAALEKGHDYVGTIRHQRKDSKWRDIVSKIINRVREKTTKIQMTDQGCMLRAYHRDIIEAILDSKENNTFIPALGYLFSSNPTEITVRHEARAAGQSKYPLYKLIHLNFDLMTSFSIVPLQVFSLIGMAISVISFLFVVYLAIRRLIVGPEVEGVFTLFGILFFLAGVILFGIGLLGEYIGRINVQVRDRSPYLVRSVLEPQQQQEPERLKLSL
jgi:undecaprenyl-phosphate 4-deoxy-4-formamido-L-arabinose transferase